MSDRCGDEEAARQLDIDSHFFADIQFSGKLPLVFRVIDHMVIKTLFRAHCADIQLSAQLSGSKNVAVISRLQAVVCNVLHNHRCFLIVDDPAHFQDERFRIIPEHGKLERRHALQNCCNACARESGFFDQLPDEVIPHAAERGRFGRLLVCLCLAEALTIF